MRQIITLIDVTFDAHFITAIVYKNKAYCEVILTCPNNLNFHRDDISYATGDIRTSSFLPLSKSVSIKEISTEESIQLDFFRNENKTINLSQHNEKEYVKFP